MSRPIIASDADLSPPEEALMAGAARGETVDLGGGKIRGRVLRALLNGSRPDWPVAESGVRVSKAVLTDGIDFKGCTVSVPILMSGVHILAQTRGAVLLRDARLKRLSMQDCRLDGPLVADRAEVENGVLIAGGRIDGPIPARGAQLGGALSVEGTQVGNGREALTANGLRLSGPLVLRRARLKGDVKLARCQLNAGIYAENMTIDGSACGFDAESARIDGDFLASSARVTARLCLAHARLLGRLEATGLSVEDPQIAISARSFNVGQGINRVEA